MIDIATRIVADVIRMSPPGIMRIKPYIVDRDMVLWLGFSKEKPDLNTLPVEPVPKNQNIQEWWVGREHSPVIIQSSQMRALIWPCVPERYPNGDLAFTPILEDPSLGYLWTIIPRGSL